MRIKRKIADGLLASDWLLKNVGPSNAASVFRRRNIHCISQVEINYEDEYVLLTVASFEAGQAEYIVYFEDMEQAARAITEIERFAEHLSVTNSTALAEKLCELFPDDVYFFDGHTKRRLTSGDIREISATSPLK